MNLELLFTETSFSLVYHVVDNTLQVIFQVQEEVENLETYLTDLPLDSIVAALEIRSPYGLMLNGSLFYTNNDPVEFSSNIITFFGNDLISTLTLNFAFYGSTPFYQNQVFGKYQLIYHLQAPYTQITFNHPLDISPGSIASVEIIPLENPFYVTTCFARGTKILCGKTNTFVEIETLAASTPFVELNMMNTEQEVVENVVVKIVSFVEKNPANLYCFYQNEQAFYLSGEHAVYFPKKQCWQHVKCMNKVMRVFPEKVEYFHILLAEAKDWKKYRVMLQENLQAETLYFGAPFSLTWTCLEKECKALKYGKDMFAKKKFW